MFGVSNPATRGSTDEQAFRWYSDMSAATLRSLVGLLDRVDAEASIGLPPRVLQIPPYRCCGPAFQLHPLRWTDKILCRFFGAPATLSCCARVFPDHPDHLLTVPVGSFRHYHPPTTLSTAASIAPSPSPHRRGRLLPRGGSEGLAAAWAAPRAAQRSRQAAAGGGEPVLG